ncbi:hypothetical protein NOR51B_1012 [Luminiphilus syltensis NOR5-1B]|uniref:Uncharacterized protein n=2 Tax=Luminiphilus TaxID=1341118 RepID=B8KYH5_9GAMM|nr:hypothetical protein NOR51B_1012 [Luminiphilus syltensis NOR5-1B]
MASLLLDAWEGAPEHLMAGSSAIDAAYAPAVRLHLLDAYGWFLLAVQRISPLPGTPPQGVDQLPDRAAGIGRPGEIEEYRRLEREGWLSRLCAPLPAGMPARRRPGSLAVSNDYLDIAACRECKDHFEALFARMSDSLDEY